MKYIVEKTPIYKFYRIIDITVDLLCIDKAVYAIYNTSNSTIKPRSEI